MTMAQDAAMMALNRLTKWRAHFAGWQLGTRLKGDPESDAVRDHREVTMLLRVENTVLIKMLIDRGVFTQDEWLLELADEADRLAADYADRWPGATATDDGMTYDKRALAWMQGWRP